MNFAWFRLLTLILLALPAAAAAEGGLPKKALVLTDIGRPPVEAEFSPVNLNLFKGTCETMSYGTWLKDVDLGQKITVILRNQTYEAIGSGYVLFKNSGHDCELTATNISQIEFTAHHELSTDITLRVTLDLKNKKVKFERSKFWQGSAGLGQITEFY